MSHLNEMVLQLDICNPRKASQLCSLVARITDIPQQDNEEKNNCNYNIYIFNVLWLKECAKQGSLIYLIAVNKGLSPRVAFSVSIFH